MGADAVHRRVAAAIARRIMDGEWRPGEQIPSRRQLATEYSVHPQTIRLAVAILRRDGLLEGEARRRLTVAYGPPVRTLTDPDAPWPYATEPLDAGIRAAPPEVAARLRVPEGAQVKYETRECLDPGARSAMLVHTWWRGRHRPHASAVVEVSTMRLATDEAHALGLTVDAVAYRLARTRLDAAGDPVETADLILPLDRWELRFKLAHAPD